MERALLILGSRQPVTRPIGIWGAPEGQTFVRPDVAGRCGGAPWHVAPE